ncbi:MAG: right-handed parallel beta-helix repeat-containing protein, partial [Planctomycetota bacterium]
MKIALILVAALFVSALASPDIIYVPDDYPTIQEAIVAAANGDEVLVAAGTYVENIDFLGKAITVTSSQGAASTVIDGGNPPEPNYGSVVYFHSGEGPDSVLEGFTITNGTGTFFEYEPGEWRYCGGGIFCENSSPTITDCEITLNATDHYGGGMNNENASPVIKGCTFSLNQAALADPGVGGGGGMHNRNNSSPTITDCTFSENAIIDFGNGGGMLNQHGSSPVLTGCAFVDNMSSKWHRGGGGMYNSYDSHPILTDCIFDGNEAKSGTDGGGIYNNSCSPTLIGCTFTNNTAGSGGGMYNLYGASPSMTNCTFEGNSALSQGGGIYNYYMCSSMITDCTFEANSAEGSGGGIYYYLECSPVFTNCTFSNNSASPIGVGGGLYLSTDCTPILKDCTFTGNSAGSSGGAVRISKSSATFTACRFVKNTVSSISNIWSGGAIRCWSSSIAMTHCVFHENSTKGKGGAIYCNDFSDLAAINCFFLNNTASINVGGDSSDNNGGAIYSYKSFTTLTNCTFAGNGADDNGGAIWCHTGPIKADNTIFWNNSASAGKEVYLAGIAGLNIHYSDVDGGQSSIFVEPGSKLSWGSGMIDADPLFVDSAGNDGHITYPSPCRDAGYNQPVTEPEDFEGDPRIAYGTADMGADEFHTHFYYTGDATPSGFIEGKLVGLPGSVPVDLFFSAGIVDPPMQVKWGLFYLEPPWIMISLTMPMPSSGVLIIPATLPATPSAPYDLPMQALIGLNP